MTGAAVWAEEADADRSVSVLSGFALPDGADIRERMPVISEGPTKIFWEGWRGERVSSQILLSFSDSVNLLRCDHSALILHSENGRELRADIFTVENVLTDSGVFCDKLLPITGSVVISEVLKRVWLSCDIPRDAVQGIYTGVFRFMDKDSAVCEIPVRLDVLPLVLPPPGEWSFFLDIRQYPYAWATSQGMIPFSDTFFRSAVPALLRLREAGQKSVSCQILDSASEPSMIQFVKRKDGTWRYDYTYFDRWTTLMTDSVGVRDVLYVYGVLDVPMVLKYKDMEKDTETSVLLRADSPEYEHFMIPFLKDFAQHIYEKKRFKKVVFVFDVRAEKKFDAARSLILKYFPNADFISNGKVTHLKRFYNAMLTLSDIRMEGRSPQEKKGNLLRFSLDSEKMDIRAYTPLINEWIIGFAAAAQCGFHHDGYHPDQSGRIPWIYADNCSSVRFERLRDAIENIEKMKLLFEMLEKQSAPEMREARDSLHVMLTAYLKGGPRTEAQIIDEVSRLKHAISDLSKKMTLPDYPNLYFVPDTRPAPLL